MKNYFAFDSNISPNGAARRNFRFLFKPPGVLRCGDLSDAIENSATAVLAPDGIAIVCIESEVSDISASLRNELGLQQATSRLRGRISLYLCSVQKTGKIVLKEEIINPAPGDGALLTAASSEIFKAGLALLFSAHHVLVEAPSGFSFVKPSGDRSTHFLRAEDALCEVENVHFLSFALLHKVSQRDEQVQRPIDVVYIDTMAIASVAYALCDLYSALFEQPRPRVVSFHSHAGLEDRDFDFPQIGTSFCIISASSSMRLEGSWQSKSRCHTTEVLTLLTFDSAENHENAVFAIKDERGTVSSDSALRDIRIAGERFAPEDLKPKKILLKKDIHLSKQAVSFSKQTTKVDGLLAAMGKPATNDSKVRPLFVFGGKLQELEDYRNFVKRTALHKVPSSLQAIIYQDDETSLQMANAYADILRPYLGIGDNLKVINHRDWEAQKENINRDDAILIVAAVVGRGSKLLSISRDLRPVHFGAKTYLIGAQIAETQFQITSLQGNLKYSAEGASILVEAFISVAIGGSLAISYAREHKALRQLNLGEIQSPVAPRVDSLAGTPNGLQHNVLLPSGAALDRQLMLRPDFAYWGFSYDEDGKCSPSVLLTAAAILQQARESKDIEHAFRLGTDAFQQVVLDPENFARYNDGIIQGALLRAALPGELDYSSENEASRYMADLMAKIFIQHDQHQGEAALEFALALHTNTVKLTKEHHQELLKQIGGALNGDTSIKKLLRILLGLEPPPDSSDLPAEF